MALQGTSINWLVNNGPPHLGIRPEKVSYTSDCFDQLHEYCLQMIKSGKAYADDTDKETMNNQRRDGLPSQRRDLSPEKPLAHFEMNKGTPEGLRWCIRAKSSFDNKNKAPCLQRGKQLRFKVA